LFLPLHRGHDLDLRQGALLALLRPALVQETLAELHVALFVGMRKSESRVTVSDEGCENDA